MPIPMPEPDKFKHFKTTLTLPASNTFEQNVALLAQHYNDTILPGHGLFFDFSYTPEFEGPVLYLLRAKYGWILELPPKPPADGFIRKQNAQDN